MQAERQVGPDGQEKVVVHLEGRLAGTIVFGEEETTIVVPKFFTGWTRQIVRAAREVSQQNTGKAKSKPQKEVAPLAESDDIVL